MRTAAAERRAILFWETDPRFKSPVVSHAAGTELGGLNPKERGGKAADILLLKHDSSIFRQSSNPVYGFSMMEQVRLSGPWRTGLALP